MGDGTHASFVRPGLAVGSFPYDHADGEGYVARTRMVGLLEEGPTGVGGGYERDWGIWPGRWGSSLGEGKSPMAPISQGEKWDEPGAFAEQAESCPREEEGEPQARIQSAASNRPASPRPPLVHVRKEGDEVHVRYELRGNSTDKAEGIEVAVLADNAVVTPTKRVAWKSNGILSLPLPNGDGPYTVVARSLSHDGAGSPKVAVKFGRRSRNHKETLTYAPRVIEPNSKRGNHMLFSTRLMQRLGGVQVRALRRKERRMRAAARNLRNAPTPAVVRAFADRKAIGDR